MPWRLLALFALNGSFAAPPSKVPEVRLPVADRTARPADFTKDLFDDDADAETMGIDGPEPLPRFQPVAPGVFRSGQPNRDGLAQMAKAGVRTVLSLRYWMARDERSEVRRLGMDSSHVPMHGYEYPQFWRVDRALALIADPKRQPVLVHCAHGRDRTGAVIAAYRIVHGGMSVSAAAAEARALGCCPWPFGDIEPWLERYARYRKDGAPGDGDGTHSYVAEFRLPGFAYEPAALDPGYLFDGARVRRVADFGVVGAGSPTAPPPGPKVRPARFGRRPPVIPRIGKLDEARRAALLRGALKVLEKNRESFDTPNGRVRFTSPDKDRYPFQWLWDSAFHAIGLRHVDPARAADELRSLFAAQWPNGLIPNMVHVRTDVLSRRHAAAAGKALLHGRLLKAIGEGRKALSFLFQDRFMDVMHIRKKRSSGITQPPILAEAVSAVHAKLGFKEGNAFLEESYPALLRYYDWLDRERVKDGLLVIYHSWESGADNSPRFDPVYRQKAGKFSETWFNLTKKFPAIRALKRRGFASSDRFVVKSVDMNTYYYENLRSLAGIARLTGRPEEAKVLEARALSVREATLTQLWDKERKGFRDRALIDGRWQVLPAATPFDFMPLYSGMLEQDDAKVDEMIRQLTDPERFWLSYPIPSVARDEPSFDPKEYWRGTSWVNINYFLARGLLRHGRTAKARELIERTLEMVEKGGFREYFNPETAKGERARNYSWTAALVIELDAMLKGLPPSPKS